MSEQESEPSTHDGQFLRFIKSITAVVGVVAAVFGVIVAYDPASTVWCKDFGTLCTYEVETHPVTVSVSPGNPCDNAALSICIERTTTKRLLDTSSLKFVRQVGPGAYDDIKPNPRLTSDPNGAGWYRDPKSLSNPAKACVIVYAHTMACENKYATTGKLVAKETQPFSSLWRKDVLGQ